MTKFEACLDSDRIEEFECLVSTDSSDRTQPITLYKHCKYTELDEEFNMLYMQFFCIVVGIFALRGVRRHKNKNISLFDRRKMGNTEGNAMLVPRPSPINPGSASKHKGVRMTGEMEMLLQMSSSPSHANQGM